jgi:hypothetical protein
MALEAEPRPRPALRLSLSIGGALLAVALPAAGTPQPPATTSALPAWQLEARLLPAGDALGDYADAFGAALAADADTLAVGVPGHDLPEGEAGCVYVFERSGTAWAQTAKISAPDAGTVADFGSRLALDGDTLAVGAPGQWSGGRVYVYVRSGSAWTLQASLSAPALAYSFGGALSLSADTLAVGAPEANTGFGSGSGAVFTYVRTAGAWALEQEILGFEIAGDDRFGAAVALDGDGLAVGAPGDDPGTGIDAGAAYVFERSAGTWTQKVKLVDPAGGESHGFGHAVAFDAGTLAVAAPGQGDGRVHVYEDIAGVFIPRALLASTATGRGPFGGCLALRGDRLLVGTRTDGWTVGSAEFFLRSGSAWSPGQPLLPSDLGPGEQYGQAVALAGATPAVSAPNRLSTGAVWLWESSGPGWAIQARLDNPGTATDDEFGVAVALEGTTLVVGAPADDTTSGRGSGSVSVFERVGAAWVLRQKLLPPPEILDLPPFDSLRFGASVALSGDRLAVGAPVTWWEGRVFVYARSGGTWSQVAELAAPDATVWAGFGTAVALRGTRLLVGAPDAVKGTRRGAVYTFDETGGAWTFRERLDADDGLGASLAVAPSGLAALAGGPASDSFTLFSFASDGSSTGAGGFSAAPGGEVGRAVALTDTEGFVGAPAWSADGAYRAGAVLRLSYTANGLTLLPTLQPPDDDYGQRFGAAVAAFGSLLAVGAPGADRGVVHLYEAEDGTWTHTAVLAGSGAGSAPGFGASLAVQGGRLAVGEPRADTAVGRPSGATSVFGPTASDLSPSVVAPASAAQGSLVTVRVDLTNSGLSPAAGVAFRASFGAGLEPDTWSLTSGSCSRSGQVLACSVPTVPVGTGSVADIEVAAVAAGVWPVTVELLTTDVDPSNDASTRDVSVSPSVADVSLSISGPTYARVDSTLDFRLYLSNSGPGEAAGLAVAWTHSAGLELESVTGCDPGACRIARLGTGTKWVDLRFRVPADYAGPASVVLAASVTTASQDPQVGNNQATHEAPFVPPPSPLGFYTLTPCRLYDSRAPGAGALVAGETRIVTPYVLGCGVGFGARALALNVTVTGATAAGNLRVYPGGSPIPNVSAVNYGPGQTRAGNAVVALGPDGDLALLASPGPGTAHVVLDVVGVFR